MSVIGTLLHRRRRTPAPAAHTTRADIVQELQDQQDRVLHNGANDQALGDLTFLPSFQRPLFDLHFELLTVGHRLEGLSQAAMVRFADCEELTAALDMAQDTVGEAATQIGRVAQNTALEPRGLGSRDFHADLSDSRISAREQVLYLEELRIVGRLNEALDPEASKALDEAVARAHQVVELLAKVGLTDPGAGTALPVSTSPEGPALQTS